MEHFLKNKEVDEELSLDYLTYGFSCHRVIKNSRIDNVLLTLDEFEVLDLKLINLTTTKKERVKILTLQEIIFDVQRVEIINPSGKNIIKPDLKAKNFITLLNYKSDAYDFIFANEKELNFFAKGLLQIMKQLNNLEEDNIK